MDDLISRAAAIEICKSIVPNTNPDFYNLRSKAGYGSWMHSNGEVCAITNIETKIEALPAVDAAPVVRCRDCKYYAINRLTKAYEPDKRFNPSVCIIGEFARPRKPDWYCADGERRDEDA